jgi:hypothetical protein
MLEGSTMTSTGKHPLRQARGVLLAVVAVLALLLLPSVFSCGAQTQGRAISFRTAVQGGVADGQTGAAFVTSKGWSVELQSARTVVGPVYFYGGAPMARSIPLSSLFASVALACPTHAQYDYGAILGEVLEQHVVDLLADAPTSTGEVPGEAGTCQSAELHLHPPGDDRLAKASPKAAFDQLGGHTVVIAGTATKGETTRPFRVALDIPKEGTMRIVQNIAADVELDDATTKPGTMVVVVLLDAWFDQVDFSSLSETDEDERYLFSEDTQARAALLQAMRNRYSYRVDWRAP